MLDLPVFLEHAPGLAIREFHWLFGRQTVLSPVRAGGTRGCRLPNGIVFGCLYPITLLGARESVTEVALRGRLLGGRVYG